MQTTNPASSWVRAVALTGVAMVAAATPGLSESGPATGDAAPAFDLPGSDGKSHRLDDFVGKRVVVVAWYPKAFTGG